MFWPWPFFRRLDDIQTALDRIELRLVIGQRTQRMNQEQTMNALDTLEDRVSAETDVVTSVVTLLDVIHAELADAIAAGDQDRIQAVADQIESNRTAMAEAVARNTDDEPTPDEPEPTPEPQPEPTPEPVEPA